MPHSESGQPRLPSAGETWHIVEGVKDAAALHHLGFLAVGLATCRLAAKFQRLFRGVDVVIVPDRDLGGQEGAEHTARVLHGVAASGRIAPLPGPIRDHDGEDVRDVLRRPGGEEAVLECIAEAQEWELSETPQHPSRQRTDRRRQPMTEDYEDYLSRQQGQTDVANADRLLKLHGDDLRYVGPWDKWIIWDSRRWKLDDMKGVERFARDVGKRLFRKIKAELETLPQKVLNEQVSFAKYTSRSAGVSAMLAMARSEAAIHHKTLDADPWLLNVANGTIDLRAGKLRPHDRNDYITKLWRPSCTTRTPNADLARLPRSDHGRQPRPCRLAQTPGRLLPHGNHAGAHSAHAVR